MRRDCGAHPGEVENSSSARSSEGGRELDSRMCAHFRMHPHMCHSSRLGRWGLAILAQCVWGSNLDRMRSWRTSTTSLPVWSCFSLPQAFCDAGLRALPIVHRVALASGGGLHWCVMFQARRAWLVQRRRGLVADDLNAALNAHYCRWVGRWARAKVEAW